MRRLALSVLMILAACAAPTNTARKPRSVPEEGPSAAGGETVAGQSTSGERSGELPLEKADQAACRASWKQLETAIAAAARGCASDEDCEEFMTCDAVTKPNAPRLWKMRDEAKAACRGLSTAEVTCVFSPPQCWQGRCQRQGADHESGAAVGSGR
jgi:hypothetical protein